MHVWCLLVYAWYLAGIGFKLLPMQFVCGTTANNSRQKKLPPHVLHDFPPELILGLTLASPNRHEGVPRPGDISNGKTGLHEKQSIQNQVSLLSVLCLATGQKERQSQGCKFAMFACGYLGQHLHAPIHGLHLCIWYAVFDLLPLWIRKVALRLCVFEHRMQEHKGRVSDSLGHEQDAANLRDRDAVRARLSVQLDVCSPKRGDTTRSVR